MLGHYKSTLWYYTTLSTIWCTPKPTYHKVSTRRRPSFTRLFDGRTLVNHVYGTRGVKHFSWQLPPTFPNRLVLKRGVYIDSYVKTGTTRHTTIISFPVTATSDPPWTKHVVSSFSWLRPTGPQDQDRVWSTYRDLFREVKAFQIEGLDFYLYLTGQVECPNCPVSLIYYIYLHKTFHILPCVHVS